MMRPTTAAIVLVTLPLAACTADAPGYTELVPGTKQKAFSSARDNVSPVSAALAYGEALVGTPYGWWYGGPLPGADPMFTDSGPAPDPWDVGSVNCSGLMNLLLRSVGADPIGGTAAYYANYYSVSEWFDPNTYYPPGTLLIRDYYDVYDQGHVAVVDGSGAVLQSYPNCYGCSYPGVDNSLSVWSTNAWGGYYNYFDLAVRPENWLGGTAGCPSGDGAYCGGDGIDGDPNTLYACSGGSLSVIEHCALGCQSNPAGTDDECNTSCPLGNGLYCGGDGVSGNSNTLYSCYGGYLTPVQTCSAGCDWNPPGVDDSCS